MASTPQFSAIFMGIFPGTNQRALGDRTSHGIVELVHLGAVVTSEDQHRSPVEHHAAGVLGGFELGKSIDFRENPGEIAGKIH